MDLPRQQLRELSKTISHALRHEPWLYELELDDEGWVDLEILLAALGRHRARWAELEAVDAVRAHRDGVVFYAGNAQVWLADMVPPDYLR